MRPNNRRPSIAAGFGKVKLLRSRFERKDAGAQRAEFKWWTKHRNQSSFSVRTFPAQPTDSPDMSDCESMFDHIFSFNRKELPGQSACATQAISKFYGSRPTDRTVDGRIEPSEIQPSNKGFLYPKSNSPTRLDHDLESFNEQELGALGDIFSDQPSVYAEVWTNDAHFALELSHEFEDLGTDLAAVYGVIATLTGFLPTLNELEPRVQEVEDSHPECDSALTPRASDKHCPGYFVPVSESDAASILADDGSCLSYDEKSHYEPLINRTPTSSLRGYVSSTSSEIDHTEHPAFRTTSEEDDIGIETNDGSCISHGSEVHHEDLLDESSAPNVRSYARSISAEVDYTEHPAFLHTGDQEGGSTRRTSPPVACELPALFASDEEGESSEVPSPPTGPSSAIPHSPTLGGHVNRGTWYCCSLSPSEEEFFSDEAPTLAPLRFTSLPSEYEGCLSNEISRSSWPQAYRHTKPYLQFSFPGEGNRSLLPSQHEVPDDGANFLHTGLDEELDDTLYDDSDEFFSERLEDTREVKADDTMDNEAGDYVFSDAFLSSPFYPLNNERSPRKSIEFEPLPENIKKVRATRSNENSAEALDDDDTAIHDKIATSASKDNSQVSADCFETLRAYRQKAVPKVSDSSRANSPDTLLAHGSPYGARPTTRPTTPTDREVNRYLQKTARPLIQTTSWSRCKTNQSFDIDYAVNTTPSLDPEISLERIDTFASTLDMQPRWTPSYKKLAQKASLSVVTSPQELSPPKSPSTTNTPKTTPTKKKFRFTGSWGRKGNLPADLRNNPREVRESERMCSPSPPSPRNALTCASYISPPSQRSPAYMSPVTQFQYQSSPQRTAPSTPLDELPPIPPRNPRRLDVGVWNASFPEMQQESIHFFNQLDPNLQKFYDEQKLQKLREFTNTRVVYHDTGDPRIDYMKHPNHNRVWESHNLRCRVHEGNCAVCYAACCIHQSAEQTVKDIVNLPEEKRNARKLLSEINMYFKAGEEPTFVVCSSCEKKWKEEIQNPLNHTDRLDIDEKVTRRVMSDTYLELEQKKDKAVASLKKTLRTGRGTGDIVKNTFVKLR